MNSHPIKTALLALALCWGMTAVAQEATGEAVPATDSAAVAEATPVDAANEAAPADDAVPASDTAATADAASATETAPAAEAGSAADAATGRIVFFRPKKFAGGAIRFKVREGDAVLGKLGSGTFFTADVPAGTHTYYAKSEGKDDTLVMEVEAGETYYVSGTIAMGMFAGQGNLSPSDQAAFDEANKKKLKDVTGQDVE